MTTDRELDEILAEIGREHRVICPPDKLESVLRAAAAGRKHAIGTPGLRFRWTLAAAMILLAAVATVALRWQSHRSRQPQNQQVRSVPVPQVRPEPVLPLERATGPLRPSSKPASGRKTGRDHGNRRDSSPQPATLSSLDEFVPLPVSEGLPPAVELSVVRVKVRGSDLQQFGLETPADAVAHAMSAEFVVGEDGLPRAIRIIR